MEAPVPVPARGELGPAEWPSVEAAVGGGGPSGRLAKCPPLAGPVLPLPTLPLGGRIRGNEGSCTGTAGGGPAGFAPTGGGAASSPEELSRSLLVVELSVSSSASASAGPELALGLARLALDAGRLRLCLGGMISTGRREGLAEVLSLSQD